MAEPILVVDDEPDTRYFVSAALREEGYEVTTAVDGPEAVRLVADQRPALVLLDWRLPGQNGDQVAEAIRERHPDAKFAIITADGRAPAKAQQVRTRWYLQKPFLIEQLMELVSAALGSSHAGA